MPIILTLHMYNLQTVLFAPCMHPVNFAAPKSMFSFFFCRHSPLSGVRITAPIVLVDHEGLKRTGEAWKPIVPESAVLTRKENMRSSGGFLRSSGGSSRSNGGSSRSSGGSLEATPDC
jgi:hypothetical protein